MQFAKRRRGKRFRPFRRKRAGRFGEPRESAADSSDSRVANAEFVQKFDLGSFQFTVKLEKPSKIRLKLQPGGADEEAADSNFAAEAAIIKRERDQAVPLPVESNVQLRTAFADAGDERLPVHQHLQRGAQRPESAYNTKTAQLEPQKPGHP